MADDSAAPSKPQANRRRFRRLRIIGGVICLLALLTFVAVHTPPARRFAAQQVVALLAREQIEFSTDELGYNLFGASFNLRNVRIRSTTWPDAPVFATIGRARINLSLFQLLRGRYVVQSGSAEDITVHYVVDEQGRDNLPRPPSDPDEPGKPLDYLIESLTVSRARVRYENRVQQIDAQLPVSSISVTGNDLTDRHLIRLEAGGGDVQVQDRHASIDRLMGEVDLGDDDASIEQLQIEATGSRADVTGTISKFAAPVADLVVKSTVDAMRVAPIAKVDDPVSGSIAIDATAKGPLATPAIDAHLSGTGLQFRDLRDAQIDAQAAYDVAARRADVSSLQIRGPWGGVTGQGRVALDGSEHSRLSANIDGLDAGSIMRALRSPFVAATRVDGTVQAEWPGLEFLKASGQAEANLTPTAARANRSAMPLGGRIVAHGAGNGIEAQLLQLATPGADVAGRVAVTGDRRLEGHVKGRSGDLARLVASVEALLGRPNGSLLPTSVAGAAEVDAQLGGTIDSPSAATTLNAPALKVGVADGIALNAEAKYAQSAVDIGRADLTWKDARARVDGRIGLDRARQIKLTLSADQLDIASILQALNKGDLPIAGSVSARGNVDGTLDRPTANVTAQGSDVVVYEEQIGSFNGNVRLDGRQVVLSDLKVEKPQQDAPGQLTASGTYHLDQKTYTFDLKSDNVRLVGLVLPSGQHVRGNIELAAQGEGSVDSPAGKLDLNAKDVQLDEAQLGAVAVKAVAANNEANITASAERFNLDADALIGLTRPFPATVKVRADNLNLAALPLAGRLKAAPTNEKQASPTAKDAAPTEEKAATRTDEKAMASTDEKVAPPTPAYAGLQGHVRATIEASGNLTEPEAGKATAALDAFEGTWNGRPFKVVSPSPLQYADERLTVEKLQLSASDASLTLTGELPLTDDAGTGEMNVDLRGNLTTFAQYMETDTNLAADGTVTMTGSIKGTLKRIDPDLTLEVNHGLILSRSLDPGLSNIELKATLADGEARVEQLSANWGTAKIEGSGRIPLEAVPPLPVEIPRMGGPTTFKAAITGLDPASIPGAPAGTSGTISVNAEMSAEKPTLAALQGRVVFQELELAKSGVSLAQQRASEITIASGAATVEQLELSGTAGDIKASGRVELVADRAIDVNVDGKLNVAAISVFTNKVRAEGDSTLNVHARGTMSAPEFTGSVELANGTFVSSEPNIAGENLNAHVDLDGKRIVLTKLNADVNGGTLTGSGSLTLGDGSVSDIDVQLTTHGFAYDAPLDLRSISDADIRISRRGEDIVIGGQVTINEAGLTGDFNFDTGLLAAMSARRRLDLTEKRNPLLEHVRFNINVDTATPILVDNNIARAELETDLRLVGTAYQPGVLGEVRLLEGSEVRLNERRYEAKPSVIDFVDERRIFPSFDLHLKTKVNRYDITIAVTGTPDDTETTLTSDPPLPEPDIMAMLVTGRTLDEMRGAEYEVAREQVLSQLAGRVGSQLGRGLQQATGFSEVRIEPTLIANEADPGARLTVGQEVTPDLKIVYSTNLNDSNDQIWIAQYDVTRRFQTQGVRQSDNSYRADFRHDVRWGGTPDPSRTARVQPNVTEVKVTSSDGMDEAELRQKFGVRAGDKYDFFRIRNGVRRIDETLIEQGYLQARVRLERQVEGDQARLILNVRRGPIVNLRFMGATPPRRVQEEVRMRWHRGVFDNQRAEDGVDTLREWLMSDKYLQPKIAYHVQDGADGARSVVFDIQPGPQSERVVVVFEGASAIHPDVLDSIIRQQRLERRMFTDPLVVTELLQRYYHERGYLAAEIDIPRYEFGPTARVVFTVREGEAFTARRVTVSGVHVYTPDEIVAQLPVVAGQRFVPVAAENALSKIRELYWKRGYNDVHSDYSLVVDRGGAQVDVAFEIEEGRQSIIADIRIAGNERVSDHLVSEQIQLMPGQPLDLGVLARSRRNLYDTGAFSVVDITRRERRGLGEDPVEAAPDQRPMDVNVMMREVQPFRMRYGASYDSERGVGGIFDISNKNSLGGAREIGLMSRYDKQLHEVRAFLTQPALRYLPRTIFAAYLREEENPPSEITDPFDTSRKGVSIESEHRLHNRYVLTYSYRYEHARTLTPTPIGIIEEPITVSPLTATLTRESRDEALDATRGSFLAQAFSFSPSWLGADDPYIKYYGQYFRYFPLQPPTRRPFTNVLERPRLVYATGVRIGLSRGLSGGTFFVPKTERFFAGGSQTLRGFGQNVVGPIGPDNDPLGGEALVVLNNELRFPLISIMDGVGFVDIGNVFLNVKNFSFTDLRQSAGFGVRVRTPWVLLRGDWGFVLDPRPGEPRNRVYVSIGQAF